MRRLAYLIASFAAAALAPSWRSRMVLGASGRLVYGLATLLAPGLVAGRLAAPAPESSYMNLRGFGGQHVAVAVFTLAAARSPALARPGVLLNAGLEVCDGVAGGLEVRRRGAGDAVAMGGVMLPLVNLAYWGSTLRAIGSPAATRGGGASRRPALRPDRRRSILAGRR